MKKASLIISILALLLFVDIAKVSAQEKAVIPYAPVRENDIMWKKKVWREIDFRQKMNLPFYYPENAKNGNRSFIKVIVDGLSEGLIQCYDSEELIKEVPYSKLRDGKLDKWQYTTTTENGIQKMDSIKIEFRMNSVERLRIMEEWYVDSKRSQLEVRIIGMAPVVLREEIIGADTLQIPDELFWIKYNDSTRRELAKAPFFNRNNSAARLSYDEVFIKRMFDSYIYKEDNVYDRRIGDYAKGVDALYESERVKQEIINYEQNLWEY